MTKYLPEMIVLHIIASIVWFTFYVAFNSTCVTEKKLYVERSFGLDYPVDEYTNTGGLPTYYIVQRTCTLNKNKGNE